MKFASDYEHYDFLADHLLACGIHDWGKASLGPGRCIFLRMALDIAVDVYMLFKLFPFSEGRVFSEFGEFALAADERVPELQQ